MGGGEEESKGGRAREREREGKGGREGGIQKGRQWKGRREKFPMRKDSSHLMTFIILHPATQLTPSIQVIKVE